MKYVFLIGILLVLCAVGLAETMSHDQSPAQVLSEDKVTESLRALLGDHFTPFMSAVERAMAVRGNSQSGTEEERDSLATSRIVSAITTALDTLPETTTTSRAENAKKLRGLLNAKYANSFLSGDGGAIEKAFQFEPILPDAIPPGVHFGGAGLREMNIRNKTDIPLRISGHFSLMKKGDEAMGDYSQFRNQYRAWLPMTFDESDKPSENPAKMIPKPAQNPVAALLYPPGTAFLWQKRGPGPVFLEVRDTQGNVIGPNDKNIEVVFDMANQQILIQPRVHLSQK